MGHAFEPEVEIEIIAGQVPVVQPVVVGRVGEVVVEVRVFDPRLVGAVLEEPDVQPLGAVVTVGDGQVDAQLVEPVTFLLGRQSEAVAVQEEAFGDVLVVAIVVVIGVPEEEGVADGEVRLQIVLRSLRPDTRRQQEGQQQETGILMHGVLAPER